jgi:hypothetical protein
MAPRSHSLQAWAAPPTPTHALGYKSSAQSKAIPTALLPASNVITSLLARRGTGITAALALAPTDLLPGFSVAVAAFEGGGMSKHKHGGAASG